MVQLLISHFLMGSDQILLMLLVVVGTFDYKDKSHGSFTDLHFALGQNFRFGNDRFIRK